MTIPISAVIITKNEEKRIERTLRSIQWCNEIVIVDDYSTDGTIDICNKFMCRLFSRSFDGFGQQKRFAVSQASHDWILSIDADEVITDELRSEIQSILKEHATTISGVYLPFTMVFLGRPMKSFQQREMKLRLFNKNAGMFNTNAIHEYVELQGTTLVASNHVIHYSYDTLWQYIEKFNAYTERAARDIDTKKKRLYIPYIGVRVLFEFVKQYIMKRSFLDGAHGFVWSLLSAFYPAVKYCKVWERRLKNENGMLKSGAKRS